MQKRVALALSLLAPAGVAWFVAGFDPRAVADAWWVPASGAAVAVVWLVVLRRAFALMLVAAGLAALGAQSTAGGRAMLDVATDATTEGAFPFFDLREGGIPEPVPPYVRVSGFVRNGWTLDEYAVERGDLPDQSAEPIAVLVPVVGAPPVVLDDDSEGRKGNPIAPDTAVVVARVAPNTAFDGASLTGLSGKTAPLEADVLHTLVQVQGDASAVRGVLVDTLALPSRRDAWLELGLAAIALLVAMACGFVAAAPRPDES